MPLDTARARRYLNDFDLLTLFVEELGWDHHRQELVVPVDGQDFHLQAIAHKRGLVAFHCTPGPDGRIPPYALRRKIETQLAKSVNQHLIVYADAGHTQQVWQWVKREAGRPTAAREQSFYRSQSGEALIQKLQAVTFSLEEEERLTLVEVAGRVKAGFDVERVTKRFYERFKTEHAAFLKFLRGIPDEAAQRWYASVMINRLMFIYFIQKKGFLDGDPNYLRTRLATCMTAAPDRYYADFLCPLFFQGFAQRETDRSVEINRLLGQVPYLDGGLFQEHSVERAYGAAIQIDDAAFERLFDFFDAYHWHLDERPLRADNEINPDVLGYIFEKYINQKQMGAYYTKEDITGYISQNTIIPYLLDAARRDCRVAFEGDHSVWGLLAADPDRYIYPAMRHGTELPLPPEIAMGLDDVARRTEWNRSAPAGYALPTEIWREVVARRQRYVEVKSNLQSPTSNLHSINDLITYNLDIRQFAQDVIAECEGPELLRAFWRAIGSITVLDPTVGSGAFLFAALNVLEPLYEGCLERMQAFVDDHDAGRLKAPQPARSLPAEASSDSSQADWEFMGVAATSSRPSPARFSDFRKVLARVAQHPNRRYFILKSIVVNNLYGVDIMEEAVEICKLRLFLKLVAQVERVGDIEPLPDIDFNVRAGNTLVGYATRADVERGLTTTATGQGKLMFAEEASALQRFEERAADVERLFGLFRQQQIELGGQVTAEDKAELRRRLGVLDDELNRALAREYGVEPKWGERYHEWLRSHRPFHWFVEFYGIMRQGGFNVIIGNPPYLELREIDYTPRGLRCLETSAVHAVCVERSIALLHFHGHASMIVPMALVSTQRMHPVQKLLESQRDVWYGNYAWRPGKLFDTVNRALTIFVALPSETPQSFSTNYQKWTAETRDGLLNMIRYVPVPPRRPAWWIPKLGSSIEFGILNRVLQVETTLGRFMGGMQHRVYYRTTGGLYWKVFTDFAPSFILNGRPSHSSRETSFGMASDQLLKSSIAVLGSDVFWWWYTVTTNLRDLNPSDLQNFPVPETALSDPQLVSLGSKYLADLQHHSSMHTRIQKQTGETETQLFKISLSKPIIDEIDRVLARHYGFTDEELDFIINYDIKYRMGDELEASGDNG